LSESRKRGLFLTLAHQFISQLDAEIHHAVLGNCSTIVSFRVGPNDAPIIGKAIDHNPKNLQELGLGQARMRTLLNGKPSHALLIRTTVPDLATGYLEGNIRNTPGTRRTASPGGPETCSWWQGESHPSVSEIVEILAASFHKNTRDDANGDYASSLLNRATAAHTATTA
jgi:hypothetical protein